MGAIRNIITGPPRQKSPPPPKPTPNTRRAFGRTFDLNIESQRNEYFDLQDQFNAGQIDATGNPIEQPATDERDTGGARRRADERSRRRAALGGRDGTVLTSSQGLTGGAAGTKKTLLGQ